MTSRDDDSDIASNATLGSNHSSAIMYIREPWERHHVHDDSNASTISDSATRPTSGDRSDRRLSRMEAASEISSQSSRLSSSAAGRNHARGLASQLNTIMEEPSANAAEDSYRSLPTDSTIRPARDHGRNNGRRGSGTSLLGAVLSIGAGAILEAFSTRSERDRGRPEHQHHHEAHHSASRRSHPSSHESHSHGYRAPRTSAGRRQSHDDPHEAYVRHLNRQRRHEERHERHHQRRRNHHRRDSAR